MTIWQTWKKSFDAWERAAAKLFEVCLQSPAVLAPAGRMLGASTRAKAASDRAMAAWWGGLGLPTKRDQERALHALNQLQSRVFDLEDKLNTLSETRSGKSSSNKTA